MNLQNSRTPEVSATKKKTTQRKKKRKKNKTKKPFIELISNERQYTKHLFNPIYLQPCTYTPESQ